MFNLQKDIYIFYFLNVWNVLFDEISRYKGYYVHSEY